MLTSIKHICVFEPFDLENVAGFLVNDIYGRRSPLSAKVVEMDGRQQMSETEVYLKQ